MNQVSSVNPKSVSELAQEASKEMILYQLAPAYPFDRVRPVPRWAVIAGLLLRDSP